MEARQPAAYHFLIFVSLVLSVLAVVTLLPWQGASKPNVLGYRSVCPLAPSATAVCGLLAGITCTLRNRLVSVRKSAARYRPPFLPLGVGLVLVVIVLLAGTSYGRAQIRYGEVIRETEGTGGRLGMVSEGTAAATVAEGGVSATLEVLCRMGRISQITLVAAQDVESSVAAELFERVIAAQSTAVDAVSGATASSGVLLRAIEAAVASLR